MMSNSSPWAPPRDDVQATPAQPPIRPPAQAGQAVELGFLAAIADDAVAPSVAAHRREIAGESPRCRPWRRFQPIPERDHEQRQYTDQHDHQIMGVLMPRSAAA